MQSLLRSAALTALMLSLSCPGALAQDRSRLPKYGSSSKSQAELEADTKFFAEVDQRYNGDRRKASHDVSMRGWQALRNGKLPDAMRRFNQAWLLDSSNGIALWGMAAVQGSNGKTTDAIELFQEADKFLGKDIDFAVDYARTLGIVAAETRNDATLRQALARFADLHQKAPQHTLNLQNWAITLFSVGNYPEAWAKIQLAEATPRRSELDPKFLAALQEKMPRP